MINFTAGAAKLDCQQLNPGTLKGPHCLKDPNLLSPSTICHHGVPGRPPFPPPEFVGHKGRPSARWDNKGGKYSKEAPKWKPGPAELQHVAAPTVPEHGLLIFTGFHWFPHVSTRLVRKQIMTRSPPRIPPFLPRLSQGLGIVPGALGALGIFGQVEAEKALSQEAHSGIAQACCDGAFHGALPGHHATAGLGVHDPGNETQRPMEMWVNSWDRIDVNRSHKYKYHVLMYIRYRYISPISVQNPHPPVMSLGSNKERQHQHDNRWYVYLSKIGRYIWWFPKIGIPLDHPCS